MWVRRDATGESEAERGERYRLHYYREFVRELGERQRRIATRSPESVREVTARRKRIGQALDLARRWGEYAEAMAARGL